MIAFLNSASRYGWLSIVLHWGTAAAIVGLFALGVWMVDLDYYSEWYKRGPDLHRSVGIVVAGAVTLRLALRVVNSPPGPLASDGAWERVIASIVHRVLLTLVLAVVTAGYLISTADGRSVDVFGWFAIPATVTFFDNQEEVFGDVHWYLSLTLISLAGLHATAALWHHFVRNDDTLRRIIGADSRE